MTYENEARASVLFPDYPEQKTPIYHTKPDQSYLNSNNHRPFEAVP